LALFAYFVQRGADAIIIQYLFSFGSTVLESKFALNVRGVAKISRKRQPVRQGKAVFFAVLDHLASDALRRHSSESGRSRQESPCLASTPAATIRSLRACAQQHPMRSIIGRSTIKVKCRA
jgi:hypothetical protein